MFYRNDINSENRDFQSFGGMRAYLGEGEGGKEQDALHFSYMYIYILSCGMRVDGPNL